MALHRPVYNIFTLDLELSVPCLDERYFVAEFLGLRIAMWANFHFTTRCSR